MGCLDFTDLLLILALTFQSRHLGLREHQAFLGGFLLQGRQAQPDSPQTMAQRYRADPGGRTWILRFRSSFGTRTWPTAGFSSAKAGTAASQNHRRPGRHRHPLCSADTALAR